MTNTPSNDESLDDPLPDTLRDFEDSLRQSPLGNGGLFSTLDGRSLGLALEKRDRLMYESGFAAAQAQLQDKTPHIGRGTRTFNVTWQTIAIAASIVAVALGSLHVLNFAQSRPQVATSTESERIASEPTSSDQKKRTVDKGRHNSQVAGHTKPHPIIWPGIAQVPHREKTTTDALSVTSSWSGWTELESRRENPIPRSNEPATNATDAPLRAFEYHRLRDRS